MITPGDDAPSSIHCWSGPRCCSTSLMYAFAQRSDTEVLDEVSSALHSARGVLGARGMQPAWQESCFPCRCGSCGMHSAPVAVGGYTVADRGPHHRPPCALLTNPLTIMRSRSTPAT